MNPGDACGAVEVMLRPLVIGEDLPDGIGGPGAPTSPSSIRSVVHEHPRRLRQGCPPRSRLQSGRGFPPSGSGTLLANGSCEQRGCREKIWTGKGPLIPQRGGVVRPPGRGHPGPTQPHARTPL